MVVITKRFWCLQSIYNLYVVTFNETCTYIEVSLRKSKYDDEVTKLPKQEQLETGECFGDLIPFNADFHSH